MRKPVAFGSLLLIGVGVLGSACGTVGTIPAYGGDGDGARTCSDFSKNLQGTSSSWALAGWTAGILAGLLSATGGIVGAGPDNAAWYRKGAGVLLATLGGSLAATSAYSVSRSNAASSAAASAASALTLEADRDMYDRCASARASWLDSRVESLDQSPPPQSRKTNAAAMKVDKDDGSDTDAKRGKATATATAGQAVAPATGNTGGNGDGRKSGK